MTIKQVICILFFLVVFSVPGMLFCKIEQATTSFLLFVLEDNHITLERYPSKMMSQSPVHLSSSVRAGHILFNLDITKPDSMAESIIFNPHNPRELILISKQNEQQVPNHFSWPLLITKHPHSLAHLEIINFELNNNNTEKSSMHNCCENSSYDQEMELIFDRPIQAACGTFIENKYFSYDKGFFTRNLSNAQVHALELLSPPKDTRQSFSREQLHQWLQNSYDHTVYYITSCWILLKKYSHQSCSHIAAKWAAFKEYVSKRKQRKQTEKALQQSFGAEDEFDKLIEEAMNSTFDFVPAHKEKESTIVHWSKGIGTYLLMRYISLEQKMRNLWQWLWKTKKMNEKDSSEQINPSIQ